MKKIKIAVVGMGNLGKACIKQIEQSENFELVAVFSRRKLQGVCSLDDIDLWAGKIDVVLVCVGSQTDAPIIVPRLVKNFSTVDCFDTHYEMAGYIDSVKSARGKNTVNIVATGWDPGVFSLMRMYMSAFFQCDVQTFWGVGVSMGHTNAIKQIFGVKDAIQFTVPVIKENRHKRICYVVADVNDHKRIEYEIKTMPHYFDTDETEVIFTDKIKKSMRHGGHVIAKDGTSSAEFKLKLKSNPWFSAQVMLAYALAAARLQSEKKFGIYTVADIAPNYLVENPIEYI